MILTALAALVATPAAAADFTVNGPFALPAGPTGTTSPYPIVFNVSGLSGEITDVNFTLTGLTHHFPDDLDVLLVGPTGASVMLMSDVGGGDNINAVTYVFDQQATISLRNHGFNPSGTYLPSNPDAGDRIPGVAGPYGSTLSVFDGTAANGAWNLYLFDDQDLDVGLLNAATLSIVTSGAAVPEPATWAMLLIGFGGLGGAMRRRPRVTVAYA